MVSKVNVLILRAPGTNCDAEAAYAFEEAGAKTELVHVNRLIEGEKSLSDYQILVVPGGFTYGDDISAGKVLANQLQKKLGEEVTDFIGKGNLILGICNGFQVLVKAGLLPEPSVEKPQQVTLTNNDSARFECRWVYLKANTKSNCVFTQGIDMMYVPVAHGEGKFVAPAELLPKLNVALYYADENGNINAGYPDNPNGSMNNIAGLSDSSGRILGLMPHPERHIRGTQHPQWTRIGAKKYGDGFKVFTNAVKWVKGL